MLENGRSQYSVRDCQLVVKYFDVDLDNALNYTEFMQMILPCDNLRLRSEASQREPKRQSNTGRLEMHLESLLVEFMERELSLHTYMENLKGLLQQRHDWNIVDVFNAIDTTQDGFLNHRNIL